MSDINKFIEMIFPMYANHIYNKEIQRKIENFGENKESLVYIKKFNIEFYKEQYSDTFKIKDKLEDKAKTNVIGITITISLILGASGIVSTIYGKYPHFYIKWIAFGVLSSAVIYMISAGILAIQVLITNNKMYFVNVANSTEVSDEQILLLEYKDCIDLNRLQNLIRNNSIFTSYECIKNALFCLFLIFVLSILPAKTVDKPINENNIINNSIDSRYEIFYSKSAIDFFKVDDIQNNVEATILNNIENKGNNNSDESVGIADNINKVFIKYVYFDNKITVLLVEYINDSTSY